MAKTITTLFIASFLMMLSYVSSCLGGRISLNVPSVSSLPIHAAEVVDVKANVIAIIGGKGIQNRRGRSKNFLVRQIEAFSDRSINVYLLPNASEYEKATYEYRASGVNLDRILALIIEIKIRNSKPIFIVGFSRGSVDASVFSKNFPHTVSGIIIISAIYTNSSRKAAEFSMEEIIGTKIDVPIVIAHHKKDQCWVTQYSHARDFFDRLEVSNKKLLSYVGGTSNGRECGPFHYHGFEGIEHKVVKDITSSILSIIAQ